MRNLGTVGGNVCHGDPGNDLPACMLALGGVFALAGPDGARTVPASEFYKDTFVTAVGPTEMLVEVRIPQPVARQGTAYHKIEKRIGDFAMAGAGARVVLDESGKVTAAGIGLTGVGATAIHATKAAAALLGQPADDAHLQQAALVAQGESQPVSDLRGPAEYKRAMAGVLTHRVLVRAVARAKGGA